MEFKRSAGVLMNISSLAGEYATGNFGGAVAFADFILKGGFHWWQILPVTTIGTGNSPYSGVSAFGGNALYIDPDALCADGLLTREERDKCVYKGNLYVADYGYAYEAARFMLARAAERGTKKFRAEISAFRSAAREWLEDYAAFMTLKEKHGGAPWWEWEKEYADHGKGTAAAVAEAYPTEYGYYIFEQFAFDRQWQSVKAKINAKGVRVIGDMPIYVSRDSADVWAHRELFQLDKDGEPTASAGVPPDYFSADGQLWGNPLYDIEANVRGGYKWWLSRFGRMFELYDAVRLDHFRAFDRYWSVKRGAKTAKEGEWKKGFGIELFDRVKEEYPDGLIIAEDLGIIDDGVRELLARTGYPGMRVMQFAFSDGDSIHLPHNFDRNTVAYTATHDNNTTYGWLYELKPDIKDYTMRYVGLRPEDWSDGGYGSKSVHAIIRKLIESSASLAIVPYQDLCGFGGDTRMNTPGVAEGNWTFRTSEACMKETDMPFFAEMNDLYGRNRK